MYITDTYIHTYIHTYRQIHTHTHTHTHAHLLYISPFVYTEFAVSPVLCIAASVCGRGEEKILPKDRGRAPFISSSIR